MISSRTNKIPEFIIDDVDKSWFWIYLAMGWLLSEKLEKVPLFMKISKKERNIFVAEGLLSGTAEVYGNHPVSTNGETWHPQASRILQLDHHLHSSMRKALLKERCSS